MSTRSLTVLPDHDGVGESVVMYRQHDGYPSGHGVELARFLVGKHVSNGIRPGVDINGPNNLAAKVVAHFTPQDEAGEIYLHPAGTRDCGEDYIYTVEVNDDDTITLKLDDYEGNRLFAGNPMDALADWLVKI